jgi:hypothetical protein
MEELQIPTHSIAVEIHTADGKQIAGALYAAEVRFVNGPPAEVIHLLNDERAFLPFQTATGKGRKREQVILNKDHIVRVRLLLAPGSPAEGEVGVNEEDAPGPCTLVLSDGTRVAGRVAVETPRFQSRLVDKLNHAERFIPVVSDEAVEFVQRSHVVRLD